MAKREDDEQKVPLSHPLFTVTCLPATVEDRRVFVRGLATPTCTCARLSGRTSYTQLSFFMDPGSGASQKVVPANNKPSLPAPLLNLFEIAFIFTLTPDTAMIHTCAREETPVIFCRSAII